MGFGLNYTDNAVRVFEPVGGETNRGQVFTTVGLFRRRGPWTIGFVRDFLSQDYFDGFDLEQWRTKLAYQLTAIDEIGLVVMRSNDEDSGRFRVLPATDVPVRLKPITQGHFYYRRTWDNLAQTTLWLGIAEGHGEENLALGGDPSPTSERIVFGADIYVPLNRWFALFGESNFITPADTGTVDAYLGIAFFPSGGAYGARSRQYAPILPVANNTSFSVDLRSP
jgi:hypothetical protein